PDNCEAVLSTCRHEGAEAPARRAQDLSMTATRPGEHFIPVRKQELIDVLCSDPSIPAQESDAFRQFCVLITSIYHFEYNQKLDDVKTAYAPCDSDADTR